MVVGIKINRRMLNMTKIDPLLINEQEKFYEQVIEYSMEPTILHYNHDIIFINEAGEKFIGAPREMIIGSLVLNTFTEQAKPAIRARIATLMKENKPAKLLDQEVLKADGTKVVVEISCHPVMYGNRVVVQTVFRDITRLRDVENANKQLTKKITELSFPIVPIVEGISVLPLIGEIDKNRAEQMLECIPMQIQGANLDYLIIDFSGVYNFDMVIVEHILKLYKVTKLLGVQSIVTGIRPDLAMMSSQLNNELQLIRTEITVMSALKSLGLKSKLVI